MNTSRKYLQSAKQSMSKYLGIEASVAEDFIKQFGEDCVERIMPGYTQSLYDAIEDIGWTLGLSPDDGKQFAKAVVEGDLSNEILKSTKDSYTLLLNCEPDITRETTCNALLRACETMYQGWADRGETPFFMKNNSQPFYIAGQPIATMNFALIEPCLDALEPLTEMFNMEIDKEAIKHEHAKDTEFYMSTLYSENLEREPENIMFEMSTLIGQQIDEEIQTPGSL